MTPDTPTLVARAMSLCSVLQYPQSVSPCHGKNRIQVRGLSIEMHRQNRLGAGCDGPLDQRRIDVECRLVWLYRHRDRAALADGKPGCDVGIARDDHLVAWADSEGQQGHVKGVESVGYANTVSGLAVVGKLVLKCHHLGAENVPTRLKHALEGLVQLGTQFDVLGLQIEKRDIHGFLHFTPAMN